MCVSDCACVDALGITSRAENGNQKKLGKEVGIVDNAYEKCMTQQINTVNDECTAQRTQGPGWVRPRGAQYHVTSVFCTNPQGKQSELCYLYPQESNPAIHNMRRGADTFAWGGWCQKRGN